LHTITAVWGNANIGYVKAQLGRHRGLVVRVALVALHVVDDVVTADLERVVKGQRSSSPGNLSKTRVVSTSAVDVGNDGRSKD